MTDDSDPYDSKHSLMTGKYITFRRCRFP